MVRASRTKRGTKSASEDSRSIAKHSGAEERSAASGAEDRSAASGAEEADGTSSPSSTRSNHRMSKRRVVELEVQVPELCPQQQPKQAMTDQKKKAEDKMHIESDHAESDVRLLMFQHEPEFREASSRRRWFRLQQKHLATQTAVFAGYDVSTLFLQFLKKNTE